MFDSRYIDTAFINASVVTVNPNDEIAEGNEDAVE